MKRDEAGDGTKSGAADNHVALRPSVGQPSTEPSEQRVPRSSSSPGPTGRETVVPTSLPNLRTLTLVAAPSGSPAVDIIFVHGLGGSSHATWAKDGTPELFWPGEWLPKELGMEKARIFTFGYNADWLSTEANNQTIGNFAMDLLALMARSRNNDTGESHEIGAMPILFVAHSMGGLVVKKAYIDALNAQSNPKYLRIGSSVNAMIFLSTPHIGSDAAPLLGKLISVSVVLSDTQFRHSLERNSETLETINEGFRHHTGKLFLASFWETLETPLFAQLSRKFPGKVQVVDKGSARLMCTGEMYMSLQADHHGVCKYTSRQDSNYLKVLNTIRDALEASGSPEIGSRLPEDPRLAMDGSSKDCAPKATYFIPSQPNENFVGRKAELAKVQGLFADKTNRMVAIHGLGGTGKTQIALQFAYWVKENHPQCSVFWVSAVSAAIFTQDCSSIARELSILSENEKDKDVKELVKEYLSGEMAGPWLLIVDNVDDANIFSLSADPSMHIAYFLPKSANGFVLCTTRVRQIAEDLGRDRAISLGEMSKRDSLDFLANSLLDKTLLSKPSITDELLTELAFLPLAIAQAAAYLNRNKLSISRYLHLLRNTDQDMSNLMSAEFLDLTRPRGAPNAIANTWIVSFEHIRLTDQTAADLLAFVSYIEPKAIPRSILPLVPPEEQLVRAIGTLLGYAFFTKRDEDMYDMHRLVQKATKIWLDKHPLVKEEARKEAVEHLADAFPDAQDSYDNMPMCREYLPHALKVAQSAQGEDLASHYTLCKLLGHFFMWDRRLRECIYWYEQVFKWRKENSGEDDAATLDSEHYLASAYLEDGRIGEAIELLKRVVAIQSQVLREDHSDRLGSQHQLASAYLKDGRIGEAIELFERIVAIES
ncbi:hypothetical protein EJ06DRAFT_534947, partial [Trichodelitschia bisporula]